MTSFPPQRIQASPQTDPTPETAKRDLKAERERAERLGHDFGQIQVLSDRPPTDPMHPFHLSIQRQVASQKDPQAEAEQHSSLSEPEKMTLISVLQEIREVSLPAADFVSGAVYQWLYNNGETGRWLLQATSPEWREMDQQAEAALPDSEAFELGRALGDGASVITGLAKMGKGGGAIAGGGTLCVAGAAPTAGGSCLAGGAAVAVGAALVVHGAGTTTAGVQGLAERLGIFFSRSSGLDEDNQRRDINSHEDSGGHTGERHVGKSEAWLRNRLANEPDLQFASSFRNEASANRTQGKFVRQFCEQIESWLSSGEARFVGEIDMGESIGIVVERGRKGNILGAVETSKARLVLRRDSSPKGWHFLTSFPVK